MTKEKKGKIIMKKELIAAIFATMLTGITVSACPQWECQLDISDYSCGGVHSTCYNEYSVRQPIYCQYCGHEMWDCVCGSESSYIYDDCGGEYDYDYGCAEESEDYSYSYGGSCGGSMQMAHWANIRSCYGEVIGQANQGDYVDVIGDDCSDCSRVIIYDYENGCQGSVLRECVYGGYSWDGTGDNGYYNTYHGEDSSSWDSCNGDDGYVDCSYSEGNGDCGYISTGGGCLGASYVSYTELISVYRQYVAATSGCVPMCW